MAQTIGKVQKENQLIRSELLTSTFTLSEKAGLVVLQKPTSDNQIFANSIISLTEGNIQLLQQTDLIVAYQIEGLEKDLNYEIEVKIKDQNGQILPLPTAKSHYSWNELTNNQGKDQVRFTQADIVESGVYYGAIYQLEITCQLKGIGLDCRDTPPKYDWSFGKNWRYYTPTAIGLTAAVIGGINLKNYEPPYAAYTQKWEQGLPLSEAQVDRQLALDKQNRNHWLFHGGVGITLATGLVWWINYRRKHLPKVRVYERYCQKKNKLNHKKALGLQFYPAQEGLGFALQF